MTKKIIILVVIVAVAGVAGVIWHKNTQRHKQVVVPVKETIEKSNDAIKQSGEPVRKDTGAIEESGKKTEQPAESPHVIADVSPSENSAKHEEKKKRKEAEMLANRVQDLLDEGRYQEALAEAEKAIASDSTNLRHLRNLRNAYSRVKRYPDAIKVCEKSLELMTQKTGEKLFFESMIHLSLLELAGRQDEAIGLLKAFLAEYPDIKIGPPFFAPAKEYLANLELAKARGLYSMYALTYKLDIEVYDMTVEDVIKLVEKHRPVLPGADEYIKMLKERKNLRDALDQPSSMEHDTQIVN